jgi:hypothetical protein
MAALTWRRSLRQSFGTLLVIDSSGRDIVQILSGIRVSSAYHIELTCIPACCQDLTLDSYFDVICLWYDIARYEHAR